MASSVCDVGNAYEFARFFNEFAKLVVLRIMVELLDDVALDEESVRVSGMRAIGPTKGAFADDCRDERRERGSLLGFGDESEAMLRMELSSREKGDSRRSAMM